jgi:hypothetical protein
MITPIGKVKKTAEYCHGKKFADQRDIKLIFKPVHLCTKFKITTVHDT